MRLKPDVEIFRIFFSWLYTGQLGLSAAATCSRATELCRIYTFAAQCNVKALRNATVTALISLYSREMSFERSTTSTMKPRCPRCKLSKLRTFERVNNRSA
ncbi:hypothetical protein BJ546DRAFT_601034 [Cryomyces antarcticus]